MAVKNSVSQPYLSHSTFSKILNTISNHQKRSQKVYIYIYISALLMVSDYTLAFHWLGVSDIQ